MIRALWTAATGMTAQQTNLDVISNNLANVNTLGFKGSRAEFQDLMYQSTRSAGTTVAAGSAVPVSSEVGLGTRLGAIQKVFGQGEFEQTGNSLDLAIEGDGFFQILQPDGTVAYTRDGSLKLSSDGSLVTSDGLMVQPQITIPQGATEISIGPDGTVSAIVAGQSEPQNVGQITLARFLNPGGLRSVGRNLYQSTAASGEAITGTAGLDGLGTLAQGFVEMSNVEVVEEMVKMIMAQRAYEVNSKSIRSADEMLSIAVNIRR